jgi:phosphate-selective porin
MRASFIGYACVLFLSLLGGRAFAQTPAPAQDEPGPIRIGQFLFSGYIQYDFLTENRAEEHSQFDMRRLRFQVTGPITKGIKFLVSAETTGSPVLRDGYITLDYLPAFTVSIGQMVMPYSYERFVASSNTLEFTERVVIELSPSRDMGLMVTNARPFFGWLTYAGAIANGTAMNTADNNDAKDAMLRLSAAPPKIPGLHVAVNGARGEQPDGMRTRLGADVGFDRRQYRVVAEFLQDRTKDGEVKQDGFYGFASWRIYPAAAKKGFDHLELAGRYGGRHGDVANTRQWDLAANYYVSRNARFMLDFIIPDDPLQTGTGLVLHARANVRF